MNRLRVVGSSSAIVCLLVAVSVPFTPALFATCTDPPPGLAAWWMAENNARDSIGSNSGTATGATYAAGNWRRH